MSSSQGNVVARALKKLNPSNYRPISLLSVLERHMSNLLYDHNTCALTHASPPASGAFYWAGQQQMQFCLLHMNGTKLLIAALRYVPSSTFRRHLIACPIAPLSQNWASWTSVTFYSSGSLTTWQIEVSVLQLKVLPPHPYQFSQVSPKALCLAPFCS